jgi:hypothetical protein
MLFVSPTGVSRTAIDEHSWRPGRGLGERDPAEEAAFKKVTFFTGSLSEEQTLST